MRLALGAALTAAVVLVAPATPTKVPVVSPNRVQVVAKEFYFALSRRTVPAGPAIVELVNFGEDPHDMRLERIGGTHIYRTPQVQPGNYFDLPVKLLPGSYLLWCSIANHRQLGMQVKLVVTAKK